MALNVEGSHFGIGDLNSFGVEALVDVAGDGEAGIGGGGADQLDDDLVADQRFAAPVLGDVGKEAVLDTVPLARTGRQVCDGYDEAGLLGPKRWSSRFQRRTRAPLLPPQSAVMVRR
jgi:hypothetical protein